MSPDVVTARSPAKVNLGLSVGPLGPDGFHRLATVYQAVSLWDRVRAERPARRGEFTLAIEGDTTGAVPLDDSNLALRAARRLAAMFDVGAGVALTLRKSIAVAGGLAGGSTDAAAALVACDALWGTGATIEQLHVVAAGLGSDVPFCLVGGTAVGTGRGEHVTPALARGSLEWVLAYADGGLSTPAVYAALDEIRAVDGDEVGAAPQVAAGLMGALRAGDPYAVAAALHNDLQPAALRLRPALRRTLKFGLEHGAIGAIVSGSGPTCAFLAADSTRALDLAVALSGSGECASVQRATGPAPGAHLI